MSELQHDPDDCVCCFEECCNGEPQYACKSYSRGYAAAQKQAEAFAHWKFLEGKREGIAEAESRYEQSHGSAYDAGIAEGIRIERERVVAFLRDFAPLSPGYGQGSLDTESEQAARRIERAEHVAEGGE